MLDDVAGVGVDEARFDGRERPADAAVDAVAEVEPAAERHADFGHAVPLEEDVAAAEVRPGGFHGRGQRGGAGDIETQVCGLESFFRGFLQGLVQLRVGGEHAVVDGWDDGEEGDFLSFFRVGEKGRGEALPNGLDIEGEEKFDGGAGEEGGEEGVDGAVDVVERQDVEEMVGGGVIPGLHEGVALGGKDGFGKEDSFLREP